MMEADSFESLNIVRPIVIKPDRLTREEKAVEAINKIRAWREYWEAIENRQELDKLMSYHCFSYDYEGIAEKIVAGIFADLKKYNQGL